MRKKKQHAADSQFDEGVPVRDPLADAPVIDNYIPDQNYSSSDKVGERKENIDENKFLPEISEAETKCYAEPVDVFGEEMNEAHVSVTSPLTSKDNKTIVGHE